MTQRAIRILSLSLLLLGVAAIDVSLPLADGPWSGRRLISSAHSPIDSIAAQRRRRRRRRPAPRPGRLIPRQRIREIQQALVERGFLKKVTGHYDKATVEAMKAFQASENIRVTGYPTAHALRRLGLSPGPTPKPSEQSSKASSHKTEQPGKQ